ncbi:mitochondrial inner membrane i-AAA protease supercomplex subunit Yme1p [Monosporozyma servazzii]
MTLNVLLNGSNIVRAGLYRQSVLSASSLLLTRNLSNSLLGNNSTFANQYKNNNNSIQRYSDNIKWREKFYSTDNGGSKVTKKNSSTKTSKDDAVKKASSAAKIDNLEDTQHSMKTKAHPIQESVDNTSPNNTSKSTNSGNINASASSSSSSLTSRLYSSLYGNKQEKRAEAKSVNDGVIDHSLLATKEQEANRNISSPESQAEFYRLLLQANYPQYVVSRFETPGIASSPECMELYMEGLQRTGRHSEADAVRQRLLTASSAGAVNPSLASSPDNNATYPSNNFPSMYSPFYGSRKEPLHVIVAESTLTVVSRWVKWLLVIGLLTYGVSETFKYISENTSLLKNSEVADKSVDVAKTDVKFDDVKGCDEARAELEEIVDFLKDPTKYESLGGKLPKGVLLTGPPGTGKTLLARATAGEAGVDFFFMSGSEFDEVYVGVGAKRIRELFAQARSRAPAIIFIDELDAIGGKRNPKDQAYAKQTLNQLLVELDGFSQTSGIIIIGATNFPESLDKALTRPGRFDKVVNVDLPDVRGRADILKLHMRKITMAKDVDSTIIARGTPGLSGAELANLVNQAAVYACQKNALAVDMSHFEWAKDKILMGAERKTMVLTDAARKATAFHEAGHAIMAMYTTGATPLYKATILPRGRALGITFQLPEMDKVDITKKECLARLDVCMGGKIAEEIIYGRENTTSGCGSDLQNATSTARAMITQYGMSDDVGPVNLSDNWDSWSGKIRDIADNEIIELLKESEERTRRLLAKKSTELHRLAEGLVEYETLDAAEIAKVCKGEKLSRLKMSTNKVIEGPDSDERKDLGGKSKIPTLIKA